METKARLRRALSLGRPYLEKLDTTDQEWHHFSIMVRQDLAGIASAELKMLLHNLFAGPGRVDMADRVGALLRFALMLPLGIFLGLPGYAMARSMRDRQR